MTREEARQWFMKVYSEIKGKGYADENEEAYELAIKALEQEPCDVFDKYGNYKYPSDVELTEPNTATSTPCDDAISRQAVVNAIKYAQVNFTINSTINFANYTKEVQAIVDNILSAQIKAINELPSVRPQEQIGHCKDCKYFEYDKWLYINEMPVIVAHEVCNRWAGGWKTKADGYCFLFERGDTE